jgi:hypothetical protein
VFRHPGVTIISVYCGLGADISVLFSSMRSGHGFVNDLRPGPDLSSAVVQPTMVIATRTDRGVPIATPNR